MWILYKKWTLKKKHKVVNMLWKRFSLLISTQKFHWKVLTLSDNFDFWQYIWLKIFLNGSEIFLITFLASFYVTTLVNPRSDSINSKTCNLIDFLKTAKHWSLFLFLSLHLSTYLSIYVSTYIYILSDDLFVNVFPLTSFWLWNFKI